MRSRSPFGQRPWLRVMLVAAASQDVRCNPPQLILLQATPMIEGKAGAFNLEKFVMRDAKLQRFVSEHYAPAERGNGMTAWFRRGKVAREPGLTCREIT